MLFKFNSFFHSLECLVLLPSNTAFLETMIKGVINHSFDEELISEL